jgi:ribosome-associated protein
MPPRVSPRALEVSKSAASTDFAMPARAARPSAPFIRHKGFIVTCLETNARLHYIRKGRRRADRRVKTEESDLTHHAPAAQAASPAGPLAALAGGTGSDALLSLILASLEDDKAEDIVVIPLAGKSEMSDHMVIATGRSTRQVSAISEKLVDRLKHEAGLVARTEGRDVGDWVLIDAGDVIVHVFRPEVRDFYQLERMWMPQAAVAQRPKAVDTA